MVELNIPNRGRQLKAFADDTVSSMSACGFDASLVHYLVADLVELKSQDYRATIKSSIKLTLRALLNLYRSLEHTVSLHIPRVPGKAHIFFFSRKRIDQKELFNNIFNECGEPKIWIEPDRKKKQVSTLKHLGQFFKQLLTAFKVYRLIEVKYKKLYSAIYVVTQYRILGEFKATLEKKRLDEFAKSVTLFMDYVGLDSILRDQAKSARIPTICVQHGMPLKLKEDDWSVSNVLLFYTAVDYWLVWGEIAKQRHVEATGIKSSQVYSLGYLNCSDKDVRLVGAPQYIQTETLLVCLSQRRWNVQNKKMIELGIAISKEKGVALLVKPHPSLNVRDYSLLGIADEELLVRNMELGEKSAVLGICYHSTLYYELLASGIKCLRYRDELFDEFPGLQDCVEDYGSAMKHFETLDSLDGHNEYMANAKGLLDRFYGPVMGVKNAYREFYDNLDGKKQPSNEEYSLSVLR